jgi:hypothetical protein
MAKKITRVSLEAGKQKQSLEISHAERLLKMSNNGGWKLPKDSPFEYTPEHGLRTRGNKRTS